MHSVCLTGNRSMKREKLNHRHNIVRKILQVSNSEKLTSWWVTRRDFLSVSNSKKLNDRYISVKELLYCVTASQVFGYGCSNVAKLFEK